MTQEQKLSALRSWMRKRKIDAVMIPRGDIFQGEEVPPSEERLKFISGFTGSAGMAVVTLNHGAVFSDGRYSLQMANDVGDDWTCHTLPEDKPSDWLGAHLSEGVLGIDGTLITLAGWRALEESLPSGMSLMALEDNPIDAIWQDRPAPPAQSAWTYPDAYAGQSREDKVKSVTDEMAETDHLLIAGPDQLCWLLNIRGSDLETTPFYRAFASLSKSGEVTIFTEQNRLLDIDQSYLQVRDEGDLLPYLKSLGDAKISMDPASCPYALAEILGDRAVESPSPITLMKARKNETEVEGFRASHKRDAVAMVRFLCWLDKNVGSGIRESAVGDILLQLRSEAEDFICPSFATICGSGAHSAIIHYRAVAGADKEIESDTLCLIDSGGHYLDATTDITRTVAVGAPSDAMRHDFTHVLRGHIALDLAIFPRGTTGVHLDTIARVPLWGAGMDYPHGTGHGVGCCLGVHEGPANISKRGHVVIEEGMVLSNEPGFYLEGEYGIRIENLVIVRRHPDWEDYLHLEHVTLVPLDKRLIAWDLLDEGERSWVNTYHQEVRDKIGEDVAALGDEEVWAWFDEATRPMIS